MNDPVIIGFGNKARQGKDLAASYIKDFLDKEYPDKYSTHILHWADAVKEEVYVKDYKYPLIHKHILDKEYYFILDQTGSRPLYHIYTKDEVPRLADIMTNREAVYFRGMNEIKDSELLQFWGTDFRRKFFSESYWVDKLNEKIEMLKNTTNKELIVLIPDTRFLNEHKYIKSNKNGYYVKVSRSTELGKVYVAEDRDPKHISETDLDNIFQDWSLFAESGNLEQLKDTALFFICTLLNERIKNGRK